MAGRSPVLVALLAARTLAGLPETMAATPSRSNSSITSRARSGRRLALGWDHPAPGQQPDPSQGQAALQTLTAAIPNHWMTSMAWASTEGGMVSPSAWAIFRLMVKSNAVGSSTGRSAGLAPLRILVTWVAVRRHTSRTFAP